MQQKDRERLRALAAEQMALATSPEMAAKEKMWLDHADYGKKTMPTIRLELMTFARDIVAPLLTCEDQTARMIEFRLLSNMVNHTLFHDDTLVPDHYGVGVRRRFVPFGLQVKRERTDGVGHHFIPYLSDLEEDFHKLGPSTIIPNAGMDPDQIKMAEDLFGDILPVKEESACLVVCPTQDIVHIMNMDDMYMAMYDYPELFHEMMQKLTDDYITFVDGIAQAGILTCNRGEWLNQGSYCFTHELPGGTRTHDLKDLWLYMDSQETAGISPKMFGEFVFPYYKQIMDKFGLVSYGCCESTSPIWDDYLSQVKNMRKLSVSPWCDEELIGDRLRGTNVVYLRKPSPNMIGVGSVMDEDEVRANFEKTAKCASGCKLEIAQRDVYQIGAGPEKVARYVQIIREMLEKYYKP